MARRVAFFIGCLVLMTALASVMPPAQGARTPTKTLSLGSAVEDMEVDTNRSRVYLSSRDSNAVLVLNLSSLELEQSVQVGSKTGRMTHDPSWTRLYVALAGGPGVAVVDLKTPTLEATWNLSEPTQGGQSFDVAYGPRNRVYVTMLNYMTPLVVDAATGHVVGNVSQLYSLYIGSILEVFPDEQILYIGETGVTPATVYGVDISTDSPIIAKQTGSGMLGGLLRDMAVSPDGQRLFLTTGAPSGTHVLETSSLSVVGHLSPAAGATSIFVTANGTTVYRGSEDVDLQFLSFNAATFKSVEVYSASSHPYDVVADDRTGTVVCFSAGSVISGGYYLDLYQVPKSPSGGGSNNGTDDGTQGPPSGQTPIVVIVIVAAAAVAATVVIAWWRVTRRS